jgi:CxxC motif-containing protein (DUF1111 family)
VKRFVPLVFLIPAIAIVFVGSCRKAEPLSEEDDIEWLSGGSQTVFTEGSGAYSSEFPILNAGKSEIHGVGDAAFEAQFISAPAVLRPGLGTIFNSNSCVSCHIADGRGKPPAGSEQMVSMLIRLSIPGADVHGGPNPVPGFGGQLQQRAIHGIKPEAGVNISYSEQILTFHDGEEYRLRYPSYTLENAYQPVPLGMMTSARVAPPVFGLGLLEAIDENRILENEDITDADGDGISGKANFVWDVIRQTNVLGRFGWKASQPDLLQQSAGAYNEDMGITNFIFPVESSFGQEQYDQLQDEHEVSDSLLYAVAFYIRTLAVPARRNADDPEVIMGKKIFKEAKCASCHIPKMKTKVDVAFPEISNQTIFPYTDLLLHDMGPELADHRPDYLADGFEWRTPPLWGIGLTQIVNGHQNFLHDGRARTLLEAIMWHGGEAEQSREYVRNLSQQDRSRLIKFLESL